jgi:hypothetical protein
MDTYDHLRVDAGDLIDALEYHLEDASCLLDLESGEVIHAADMPEDEDLDDPDRYLVIPAMDSFDSFQIMEDFVEGLPEGEACRALARALRLPRPFRCFKDTLFEFPSLRERWFKFQHDRMLEYAQTWLEDTLPGARLSLG